MEFYDFQIRVARCLRKGKSVIVQAPTGGGKTLAALWPYLEQWELDQPAAFPRQCIYSVPMRVLVNQFSLKAKQLVTEEMFLSKLPRITVQTGERAEDREFQGDLIFTTIDQTLSSFLNVPYALSSYMANVNAGAVVSSYLVFDEFHLFPYDDEGMGAMPAVIQMLKLLRHTTPFVLMTATFSQEMLSTLATFLELDPEEQVIVATENDLYKINTGHGKFGLRRRVFHLRPEQLLTTQAILDGHQTRSLAICNTVDRATERFNGLLNDGCRAVPVDDVRLEPFYEMIDKTRDAKKRREAVDQALSYLQEVMQETDDWQEVIWVMLLHARFLQRHRAVKEEFVRQLCGPVKERPFMLPSLIVVSTQVIEVGLNLTCETLHTEIAPANSVLQRAGRCARFPGEGGDVYVYAVPLNKRGERNYLPYSMALGQATWQALLKWDGQVVDFTAEQQIVNEALGSYDQAMLKKIREAEGRLWGRMEDALVRNENSARRELIRNVDSRTLLVYEPPEKESEESPYRMKGFSIYHGSLRRQVEPLQSWANTLELDWALKYPVARGDEQNSQTPTVYQWCTVNDQEDISASLIFAIHPKLAAYDAVRGFRFVEPNSETGGQYRTPSPPQKSGSSVDYRYQLESYANHIRTMTELYEDYHLNRLMYVARRLEKHPDPELRLPAKGLDGAIRLAIALHDAGKLQVAWQKWAHNYQKAIGGQIPNYLMAHTQSETQAHRNIARKVKPKRPNHAGEGAIAGLGVIGKGVNGKAHLAKAVMTAITRHHSPQASSLSSKTTIYYHKKTVSTIGEALVEANLPPEWANYFKTKLTAPPKLAKYLLRAGEWEWWLLYWLIVRVVRLTDGKSQED